MKQAQRNKKGRKIHDDEVRKNRSYWEKAAVDDSTKEIIDEFKKMQV